MLSAFYVDWGSHLGIRFEKDASGEDEGSLETDRHRSTLRLPLQQKYLGC